MLAFKSVGLVIVFIIAFLAIKIESQMISFNDFPSNPVVNNPTASAYCDRNFYCVQIRFCPALRNQMDWRTTGTTCAFGEGENRGVCCPRTLNIGPSTSRRRTTTTQRPWIPRPEIPSFSGTDNNIFSSDCGQSNTYTIRPFIMGGENASEGAWPWMVAIRVRNYNGVGDSFHCTGFMVDRIHVMSAAHCFVRNDPSLYLARIGRINQDEAEQFSIVRIVVPEEYDSDYFYDDIAILTLDRQVSFPNFSPICLPNPSVASKDLTGEGTTVAGWGLDRPRNQGGREQTYLKQLSRLPVVSNQRCQRRYRETMVDQFRRKFPNGIVSGMLCAGFIRGGMDSCGGDSGGPLMIQEGSRWYAVGIVSFGVECGRPDTPGGYTRVASYLNWIRQNI